LEDLVDSLILVVFIIPLSWFSAESRVGVHEGSWDSAVRMPGGRLHSLQAFERP
jgi:hypothetical protein